MPDRMAQMQQRLPSLVDHPIAFAHRGGRAHAPENTIEAFKLGLRLGATGLESDVWVTADGVPVLEHDGFVKLRLRRRPITELRRSQLPSFIPTLAELIQECGTGYHLSLDLKGDDTGRAVLEMVREVGPQLLPRLWLCSPTWQKLLPLRDHLSGAKLVDSTRLVKMKEGPERRAATLASEGIHAVNMHHTDWNGGLVSLVHRFGLAAIAWDLQYDHVLRPALRMGIDGVHSDWVDRMMDAYRTELGVPLL
ncbi:MAG: glycerophosphodiester phosphodiesterase [Actinobacteria bacterium]|nr:glycerophosphodiester phosphodiesterase [Actinomycetota bacterium]